jgi:O-antigen/teichoic acid export membrane protein
MTLLWTLVVPRTLGPDGMGTLMAAWAIVGILGIVIGLGTRNYLVRESVIDPAGAGRLIGTAIVLRVVLSPLVLGAAAAYGEVVGWDREAKLVLYLAAAATMFVQVAEPFQAGFQATERMEYLAYSDVISKSGQGLVGIVVVLAGFGVIGVTACWTAMTALVVLLDLYWLRGHLRVDLRTSVGRMIGIARESLPYWAFGLFFMLYLWIDFVMLSLMTRNEVVGWYSVPMRLFQTMMFLPVVISTAFLPRFVRGFEQGGDSLRREAKPPLEFVLLLSLPICAMTAIVADPLIGLLYGSAYANSVPVMVILGLCIPPMYLNIVLAQVLVAMKRQAAWTWVMAATTVANPLFNLALIPATERRYDNGAIGAAIALFLTEVVVVSAGFALAGRLVFDRGTVRRGALALVAAAGMWVVGYEVLVYGGAVLSLAASAVAFLLLARVLRVFTHEEIALMRSGASRLARAVPVIRRHAPSAAAGGPPPA